jgi:hypothetical protein
VSRRPLDEAIETLLAQSLRAWRVGGEVRREAAGVLLVAAAGKQVRIARAPAGLPFRWTLEEGERTRAASSVTGLLRNVRVALDPGYRQVRLRIAPLPLLAS